MSSGSRSFAAVVLSCAAFALAVAFQEPPEVAPAPHPLPDPLPGVAGPAKYWKGNLHTHTLWSDGDDFPEMVVDWYKQHGYQFLALTDHNIIADGEKWIDAESTAARQRAVRKYAARFGERWPEYRTVKDKKQVRLKPLAEFRSLFEEPSKFLLVPAEEITHSYAKRPIHMNGINLRDTVKPLDGKDAIETITVNLRQVADQRKKTGRAMIAFLNHPNFGWGVRAEEMLSAPELRYFEVFNGHPGVRNYGDAAHAATERVWDITLALRLGKHELGIVYGLATDDAHGYHEYGVGKVNPGRGWVMVKAPHLTAEAMVKGLEAGDFYASTGVVLDEIVRDGDTLRLSIRTEPGVTYKTEFVATMKDANLDATPKVLKEKDGKEVPVTSDYSPEIGKVFATSTDAKPSYKLTGKEMYVRAKVTSNKPHPNPYAKGDVEVAWTQPVIP
jgi:predicted metal-dependent phosphoesterase TrpH